MAEDGEWNRKGATLSDVTANKEYGVERDFIVQGIRAGELEYRDGSMWGNPYIRILRSQLERYVAAQFGTDCLTRRKTEKELRAVKSQIAATRRKLTALESRRTELESMMKTMPA
jgi:hypothetical protein